MPAAKEPDNEEQRLTALLHLNVLDSEPEEEFDALIRTAALACNVPIALISLIDTDRQWFKAGVGLGDVKETGRDAAFCSHAILEDDILEVNDATHDARFSDNPLVLGDPHIRFYAGAPLKLTDGSNIGTLCVIDSKPGQLSNEQRSILENLAHAASHALEARRDNIKKSKGLTLANQALAVLEYSLDPIISLDLDGKIIQWNPAATKLFGYSQAMAVGKHISLVIPADKRHEELNLKQTLALHSNGLIYNTTRLHKNSTRIEVSINLLPILNQDAELIGVTKVVKDRTQELQNLAEISANEARFRALSDASPLGVFSIDITSACTYGNTRWQEILGLSQQDCTGHHWKNRLHHEDIEMVLNELQRCAVEHIDFDVECRIKHKDGSVRHTHFRARPSINETDDFNYFIGSVEDITERISIYQRLAQSEARIRSLYESTPVMMQSLDAQGRLVSVSDLWLQKHGYTRDEVLGHEVTEFMTPESASYAKNSVIPEFIKNGYVNDIHYQKVSKSGEIFDVLLSSVLEKDMRGNYLRAKCVLIDVTEELAAKRATNELLNTLRAQFIISITDAKGDIIEVNDAFCDTSKYTAQQLLGKNHRILKSNIHPDAFYKEMWDTITKSDSWRGEVCNRAADGSLYWTQSVISPLKNSAGEIERFISIRTNITKRKAYEKSIIEQQQQVQQIIQKQSVATFMIDADHKVLHWNNACETLTGCPASEVIGSTEAWRGFYKNARPCLADLVLDKNQSLAENYYPIQGQSTLSEAAWHAESWFDNLGGKRRYAIFDAAPIYDTEGNIVAVIETLQDITELQNATKQLENKERLLKRTGEIAGVGGWEFDLIKQEITWSEQTCAIHQVAKDYRPSLEDAIDFYTVESQPKIEAAVANAINNGTAWDLELQLIQKNGIPIWVRAAGEVEYIDNKAVKLVGTLQNINDAVLQRSAIEQSNLRVKLATTSADIGIWDWNLASNELTWNDQMYTLYGLIPQSVACNYDLWRNSIHLADVNRVETALNNAVNGVGSYNTEFRVLWPDNSLHYIRATAELLFDANGNLSNVVGVNWDVTPMREMANQLAEQYESMRVTLHSIADAVITTDNHGIITWLNPVAEHLTAWSNTDAIDCPIQQVFHVLDEATKKPVGNPVTNCIEQQQISVIVEHNTLINKNGLEYGIECSVAPILDQNGKVLGTVLVFRDVTEQRKISKEIGYRASHDTLTGLVNRAEFEARLNRLFEKFATENKAHSLLFIDLDKFKLVNDSCGHAAGDRLLIEISKLIASIIRSRDTLARLGGDEFAVILEECSIEQAKRVAQTICDKVHEYKFTHEGNSFQIGASIGLAPLDRRWDNIAGAVQAADAACYIAKQAGRNQVQTWLETDNQIHH
jgi:diguanylate cyclase (GGDEF)-like protein/PAS domain S-box-containing protein